jgi:hypothetical protein
MKVLSVKNPWAYLIIFGIDLGPEKGGIRFKDVENRTWETLYRGPLLIHASRKLDENFPSEQLPPGVKWEDYNGRILGKVDLEKCVRNSKSLWAEPGMFHWVFRDPEPLRVMINICGHLGLWDYEGLYVG